VDGASEWEIVRSIIIPNIRYHIQFIALWETLGLFTNYVTILLITNGGPGNKTEVWALSAYHKAFNNQQYGYGAAISMVLILVVLVLMILMNKVMQKRNDA
jgi:inositol-phosphate transport system permease protein